MKSDHSEKTEMLSSAIRAAFYALSAILIAACSSSEQPEIWQSDDVLREAWQQKVDRDLENIHDRQQSLNEKFQQLERLYITLANDMKTGSGANARASNANARAGGGDQAAASNADFKKVEQSLASISKSLDQLGERVYAVEIEAAKNTLGPKVETLDSQAESNDGAFIEEDVPNVPILPRNEGETIEYGVHLGSYRSRDQVPGAWSDLTQQFNELDQLTAKIYVQNQEGIGTFLRLIAGPYETNEAATAACGRINAVEADQYCRVSEYQGENLN